MVSAGGLVAGRSADGHRGAPAGANRVSPPRLLAAASGVLLDRAFGEPPVTPHPVSVFGRWMRTVERSLYGDRRWRGVAHAGAGVAVGTTAGAALGSTAAATYLAVAGRALGDAALDVAVALDRGDLAAARALVVALVGRDPADLDEKALCRAVVESVAENTVDAVVAPVLWAVAGGAPGALAYRAVNTMDAMVGYRSARYRRYGWAAARLDDAANWIPARVTALLVAGVRPGAALEVARVVRRDAGGHPSPNAGVAEAAFAAALGLRLGGENRYGDRLEVRAPLGHGRPPERTDIPDAVRLSHDVGLALAGCLGAAAGVTALAARWNGPPRDRPAAQASGGPTPPGVDGPAPEATRTGQAR